jgi:hypothetical protein
MKVWTQLVRWCRCHSRRIGPAASLLLLGLLTLSGPVAAQEGETRAGLVVQFGDGTVQTACVDLGSDGEGTGEELLRATGLNVLIDYTSGFGGGTVCKIGGQGCDFPGEDCFCQCSMKPGDPCVYWVYFDQVDGQWRYSNQGASIVVVNPGDVQGWVWGAGSANAGVFPPLITFDQICSGSAAVDAPTTTPPPPTPAATSTAVPTLTSTAVPPTSTTPPTDTPVATATRSEADPSLTAVTTEPAAASQPSATPTPTATASPEPSATLTRTPNNPATPTMSPQAAASVLGTITAAPVGAEPTSPTIPPSEGTPGGPQGMNNYIFFGLLVVVLAGGLFFLRIRK